MQSIWIRTNRMRELIAKMKNADSDGLRAEDYPIKTLTNLSGVVDQVDKQSKAIIEAWFSAYFFKIRVRS